MRVRNLVGTLLAVVSLTSPLTAGAPPAPPVGDVTLATLTGGWLLGEMAEEFDAVLEVEAGGKGIAHNIRLRGDDDHIAFTFEQKSGPLFTMTASHEGETKTFYFLLTGPDEALVWRAGDDDLARALRTAPLPSALFGDWLVEDPRGRKRITAFSLSSDGATVTREGEKKPTKAYGLASRGSTIDIALSLERPDGEPVMARFQPLPAGGYLLWVDGDDDYVLVHKKGARPAWFPQPRAR